MSDEPVTDSPTQATGAPAKPAPTTIRLGNSQNTKLERIIQTTRLTKNALVNLAVDALIDFAERTGKLPVPNLKKGKRGGKSATSG